MNILKPDSPVMDFISTIADLIILDLLFIICSIPVVTFGAAYSAKYYVAMKKIRGEETGTIVPFFKAFKRNFKQSLLLGLVDVGFLFVIAFDVVSYVFSNQNFGMLLLLYLTVFLSAIYLMMRPYMYLMSVTFDLKISKILKNSWILAVSGIGRNLLCSFFVCNISELSYE